MGFDPGMTRPRRLHSDNGASYRTARVGELVRRIVAEALEELDDERLDMVSVTGVEVDRDLHRAVIWFTSLDDSEAEDNSIIEAFEEYRPRLRRAVGAQTRLRKTPMLVFRPDTVLRSAARIEQLLDGAGAVGGVDGAGAVGGVNSADGVGGVDGAGAVGGVNSADGVGGVNSAGAVGGVNSADGVGGVNSADGVGGVNSADGVDVVDGADGVGGAGQGPPEGATGG